MAIGNLAFHDGDIGHGHSLHETAAFQHADRRRIAVDGAGAQAFQPPFVLRQCNQVLQRGRGQALARLLLPDAVAYFGYALLLVDVLEVGAADQLSVFVHDDAGMHAPVCVFVQELRDVRLDAVVAVKSVGAPVDMALEPGAVGLLESQQRRCIVGAQGTNRMCAHGGSWKGMSLVTRRPARQS